MENKMWIEEIKMTSRHSSLTYFGILLLSITSLTCSETNCESLKKGVFTTETSFGTITIIRTETESIEKIPGIEENMVNSLEWTSDCEFTIQYKSGPKPDSPTSDTPIDCRIIEVKQSYHVVRAKIRGSEIEKDYRMDNLKQ